jgi:MFS family permease
MLWPVWRNRSFVAFQTAQALSAVGNSFSYVAVPLLVLQTTGSVVQMGLITALGGAASLLSGIFAGLIVDRFNRKGLLLVCDLARFLLYATVPVTWAISPQLWLLYVVVPLASAFAMLFQVAHVTVVPALVAPDQITKANGQLYAAHSVAFLAGPALAGLVSGLYGPAAAIGIDSATFALSALFLLFVRLNKNPAARRLSVRRDLATGVVYLWRHPVLRSLTILLTLLIFAEAGLTDVFIYRLKYELGQPDRIVGYVMAVGVLGTLLASLLVAHLRKRVGFAATWTGAHMLGGFAIAGVALSGEVVVIALMMTVVLFAAGVGGIASMSLRQEIVPSELLGRVTAAFWTVHNVLGPVGVAALTAATASFGSRATLAVAGALCVIVTACAFLTPIWRPASPGPRA